MRDLALGLVSLVVLLGRGEAPRLAPAAPGRAVVVPDDGGALQDIVIHWDPGAAADVIPTYRDVLRALDPATRIWVVVADLAHFRQLRRLAAVWGVGVERLRPAVTGSPITTWSRDRFTLLAAGAARRLLVRAEPHALDTARRNDWLAPFALARAAGAGVRVEVAPFDLDGGDLVASPDRLFVTAALRTRNAGGPWDDRARLTRALERIAGRPVVFLGERPADVPVHHLCMFLTPVGKDTVLVGDPAAGLALLPPGAALPGTPDRRPATWARFARVARDARAAGLRVIRIPLVPLEDGYTFVTYNNALTERRADGRLHVYLPQFGLPELDAAGRLAWNKLGAVVHAIDVSRIYRHQGAVRCLVNVLGRAAAS